MILKWIKTIFLTSKVASSKHIKGSRPTGHTDATGVGSYYPY
jgi:hypothetical protein